MLTKTRLDRRRSITVLALIFLSAGSVRAEETADAFHRGIEAYQAKDYAKAKDLFSESLAENPQSIALNTNLGLTYFQLGDKPHALAHLRRARNLDPSASTPRDALAYLRTQGVVTDVESPDGVKAFYDTLLKFAAQVPEAFLFVLSPLVLLTFGWTLIQYIARRRNGDEGVRLPKITGVAGVLWVLCVALQFLQFINERVVRATVIVEKASVLSAPQEKAPGLFEAAGGEDLEVLAVRDDWSQVANVRGEFGWVKNAELIVTTRKQLP